MHLKLLLPGETLIDAAVAKVVAESEDGQFCLLPRHVDWVAALVPGLLLHTTLDGEEHPVAVDTGTLVKCGPEVLVSVRAAVAGHDLETLRATVDREFLQLSEQDRQVRSALARLEASALRRFVELR